MNNGNKIQEWTRVLKRNDRENINTLTNELKIRFSVLYNMCDVYKTALKSKQPHLDLNLGNKNNHTQF